MGLKRFAIFLLCHLVAVSECYGDLLQNDNLLDMELNELMNLEVTSAGKKKQRLSEAASAVFVITQEDLRRSGVTSIAEALRMVPGLQVARIDANKWAVGSRGFLGLSGRFENKLLVLIDGRSIYTPLFSGVFWEMQDTMLEDIDRIEVIRGPGATLWGTNAVNGVINIITKNARETQGGLVAAGAGTEEKDFGRGRYGGKISEDAYYRLYAKYADRDPAVFAGGEDAADGWNTLRSGFRLDREFVGHDAFTLQGDIFSTKVGETITTALAYPPFAETTDEKYTNRGGNLLGRWERKVSEASAMALQMYYDRTEYNSNHFGSFVDTVDIDFQDRFKWMAGQEIIWGLGYRNIFLNIDNSYASSISPGKDNYDIVSTFLQDDIALIPERLNLILGSKLEHNDFTGVEIQPNARLIWQADDRHSVWGAVSRAVRTPSLGETDGVFRMALTDLPQYSSQGIPTQLNIIGNPDMVSETLIAYEAGYRWQPAKSFSLDASIFYNDYDKIRFAKILDSGPEYSLTPYGPIIVFPYSVTNILYGESHGIELASTWQAASWWRLQAHYSLLRMSMRSHGNGAEPFNLDDLEDRSPLHQWSLRSSFDLAKNLDLDLWARYVDAIKTIDGNTKVIEVAGYLSLDIRLGWKPTRNLELSIVGQNLLDDSHPEFVSEIFQTTPSEVQRGVYVQCTFNF